MSETSKPEPRKRGRPKGSRNKPKAPVESYGQDLEPFDLSTLGIDLTGDELAIQEYWAVSAGQLTVPLEGNSEDLEKQKSLPPPNGITIQDFKRVVVASYAQYLIEGQVTLDGVVSRSGLPAQTCREALRSAELAEALAYRGVSLRKSLGLSEKQDLLLSILSDPFDGLTTQQKLRRAGVNNTTYQAWLREPLFAEHFKALTEKLHLRTEEAMVQLVGKAGEGDLNSIKYLFEINNRYNPNRENKLDIMVIMSKILESLSKHVKDPGTLEAVAADIRQIAVDAKLMPQ